MMHTRPALRGLLSTMALLGLASCAGPNHSNKLRIGEEPTDDGGTFSAPGARVDGGGVDSEDQSLRVHVEDSRMMKVEIVTLACAGDCVEVTAVANDGNPPYAFEWEDGSFDPRRKLCATDDAVFSVSVTDTAINDAEFKHDAQTVSTQVSAQVFSCEDGGTSGECSATEITAPPPGRYVGMLTCPESTSTGGASGQTGQIQLHVGADGRTTMFFQWSLVLIGAQATLGEPDCQNGDYHATYEGVWGVPGAVDPNNPDAPPPVLPTGPITGDLTVTAAGAPGTISGNFSWYVPPVGNGEASICHGSFTAKLD